jgi:hypothetical protein
MRIRHRISTGLSTEECAAFAEAGIDLKAHRVSSYADDANFDIFESDPGWETVQRAVRRFRAWDLLLWTEFSTRELSETSHLAIVGATTTGYLDDYEERSYDLSQYCRTCGIGLVQTAPIQMGGEPKCKKGIFRLHGFADEFFVRPDVWETVFRHMGIGCRKVWNRRKQTLQTVVQLDIREAAPLDLDPSMPYEDCSACGRRRYDPKPLRRGWHPAPRASPAAMFKSTQLTGGHGDRASYKVVLLTQEMYQAIVTAKLDKGLMFAACKER